MTTVYQSSIVGIPKEPAYNPPVYLSNNFNSTLIPNNIYELAPVAVVGSYNNLTASSTSTITQPLLTPSTFDTSSIQPVITTFPSIGYIPSVSVIPPPVAAELNIVNTFSIVNAPSIQPLSPRLERIDSDIISIYVPPVPTLPSDVTILPSVTEHLAIRNNLDVTNIISEIINIPYNNNWSVVDAIPEQGLYYIKKTQGADLVQYSFIDMVVDVINKRIVTSPDNYIETIPVDPGIHLSEYNSILQEYKDGSLSLLDARGAKREFGTGVMLSPAIEGVTLKIFMHNGTVYISANNKIDSKEASIARSDTFRDLIAKAAPSWNPSSLFNSSTNSAWCHSFILVHPSLMLSSRLDVNDDGFLIYLRSEQLTPYYLDVVRFPLFNASNITTGVYSLPQLSVTNAEHYLRMGFYDMDVTTIDRRLEPGEAVIGHMPDGEMFRLEPASLKWRKILRDNNYFITQQLCYLYSDALFATSDTQSLNDYLYQYPILLPNGQQSTDVGNINTIPLRYKNIAECLKYACPVKMGAVIDTSLTKIIAARRELAKIISELMLAGDYATLKKYQSRIYQTAVLSRQRWQEARITDTGSLSLQQVVQRQLDTESGPVLWLMLREFCLISLNKR